MNVLAFDTCFDACSVAAGRGLRGLAPSICARNEPMAMGHAERLMPMIQEQLAAVGLAIGDLDLIAITIGPGTFTGTRISVAAGRALALALDVPVVAVTSLKLMAMNFAANASGAAELAIATDARRGEVYFERFNPHTLQSLAPAAVFSAAAAAAALSGAGTVVAGSGAAAVADAAQGLGRNVCAIAPDLLPDALDMLFPAMEMQAMRDIHPLYLRAPDAKPPAGAAIARSGL